MRRTFRRTGTTSSRRRPAPMSGCATFRTRPRCWPCRRSEEHTSELQSQSNLVCRLLLVKNKMRTAAGLIDDEHACLGSVLDLDGIVPRAISRAQQEVRRTPHQLWLYVERTGDVVARTAN